LPMVGRDYSGELLWTLGFRLSCPP
jgi:hypothetical protein